MMPLLWDMPMIATGRQQTRKGNDLRSKKIRWDFSLFFRKERVTQQYRSRLVFQYLILFSDGSFSLRALADYGITRKIRHFSESTHMYFKRSQMSMRR